MITSIIIWIVVGAIAGWLAGQIVRGAGFGLIGNIIVGIIGAVVAGYLLPRIGLVFSVGGPIVTAILYAAIGGIVVLVILAHQARDLIGPPVGENRRRQPDDPMSRPPLQAAGFAAPANPQPAAGPAISVRAGSSG